VTLRRFADLPDSAARPSDGPGSFASVTLPASVAAAVIAHARHRSPEECCGLLVGTRNAICAHVAARNAAADVQRRYVIDPADHFAAVRLARDRGLDVIGAYHSHPSGPSGPSRTDLEESFSGFLFVIIALGDAEPVITAWERRQGNFDPVPLVRTA
jgi:desampylase